MCDKHDFFFEFDKAFNHQLIEKFEASPDWFVRAAEDALIQFYTPLWQSSGFGSHVPGRGRPGIRISKWDQEYPPG